MQNHDEKYHIHIQILKTKNWVSSKLSKLKGLNSLPGNPSWEGKVQATDSSNNLETQLSESYALFRRGIWSNIKRTWFFLAGFFLSHQRLKIVCLANKKDTWIVPVWTPDRLIVLTWAVSLGSREKTLNQKMWKIRSMYDLSCFRTFRIDIFSGNENQKRKTYESKKFFGLLLQPCCPSTWPSWVFLLFSVVTRSIKKQKLSQQRSSIVPTCT